MRIIHVIDSLGIGGAEMLLINYLNYYKKVDPASSHILVILKKTTDLLPQVNGSVDHFEIIPFYKKKVWAGIPAWRKLLRTWKPDIIHTHLFYPCLLARFGTPWSVPVLSTYHNQSYCRDSPYYSPWYGRLDKLSFGKNHYRVFVSESVRKCVEQATGTDRTGCIIENFVSEDFYPAWSLQPRSKLRLIAVGSVKKVKNHSVLIDALALIRDADVSIDVYGDGNLRTELQDRVEKENVQIRFKGNLKLTSELLKQYDAFIMPSLSEGQPVSLLEAMTTGLPSILSRIPGLYNLAGDAALYFAPDAPDELARQIVTVMKNKAMLAAMSQTALDRSAPYSIHNYYHQMTTLYERLLQKKA